MNNPKVQLAREAAALARVVVHLELALGETKAKYWAKVEELHCIEDTGPDIAEAVQLAEFKTGGDVPEGRSLADMVERYKNEGEFKIGKGALTVDDT